MCGIAGFFSKTETHAPVGRHLLRMLAALGQRGPDSAGVAIFGTHTNNDDALLLRVKLAEDGDNAPLQDVADEVENRLRSQMRVLQCRRDGAYLRLLVSADADVQQIARMVEDAPRNGQNARGLLELVSAGRRLEIIKQVGSPQNLETTYHISRMEGTHGIGHTRLSTESRIDLSHSQPFWAHGTLDLAVVHNGHITNYHRLRRLYEERGVHFYTENDSEIIGLYLRDRLREGCTFEEALHASMIDLDGSFCYLAATENALAFAKDPYSFKPLVVAETDEWVAIATEEVALRRALGDSFTAREPAARRIQVWNQSATAVA